MKNYLNNSKFTDSSYIYIIIQTELRYIMTLTKFHSNIIQQFIFQKLLRKLFYSLLYHKGKLHTTEVLFSFLNKDGNQIFTFSNFLSSNTVTWCQIRFHMHTQIKLNRYKNIRKEGINQKSQYTNPNFDSLYESSSAACSFSLSYHVHIK